MGSGLPAGALTGSWTQEWNWAWNVGVMIWEVGVLSNDFAPGQTPPPLKAQFKLLSAFLLLCHLHHHPSAGCVPAPSPIPGQPLLWVCMAAWERAVFAFN